jgi:hypothetical protein
VNGLLLMYYDDRYREIGSVSEPSARSFAERAGLQFCCIRQERFDEPYLIKLNLLLNALENYDYVAYTDADVLFRPTATELWPGASVSPLAFSTDSNGICAGVFSAARDTDVLKLLRAWRALGACNNCGHQQDQATLKLLIQHFAWIAALVRTISHTYVSNEECAPGSVAHHFWCNVRGDAATAAKMRAFAW